MSTPRRAAAPLLLTRVFLGTAVAVALLAACAGPEYPETTLEEGEYVGVTTMSGLGHAPCAEKPCGHRCTKCGPDDRKCKEPNYEMACDEDGECVKAPVKCKKGSREIERLD
jgi:hypothetical protein